MGENRVQCFHIGTFYDRKSNGDTLKEILREYKVSMTGNKDTLLRKLAKLASRQYAERRLTDRGEVASRGWPLAAPVNLPGDEPAHHPPAAKSNMTAKVTTPRVFSGAISRPLQRNTE